MKYLLPALAFLLVVGCGPDEPTKQELLLQIEINDSIHRQHFALLEQKFMDAKDSTRTEIKNLKASVDSLKTTRRESKLGRFVGTVVKYAK